MHRTHDRRSRRTSVPEDVPLRVSNNLTALAAAGLETTAVANGDLPAPLVDQPAPAQRSERHRRGLPARTERVRKADEPGSSPVRILPDRDAIRSSSFITAGQDNCHDTCWQIVRCMAISCMAPRVAREK